MHVEKKFSPSRQGAVFSTRKKIADRRTRSVDPGRRPVRDGARMRARVRSAAGPIGMDSGPASDPRGPRIRTVPGRLLTPGSGGTPDGGSVLPVGRAFHSKNAHLAKMVGSKATKNYRPDVRTGSLRGLNGPESAVSFH